MANGNSHDAICVSGLGLATSLGLDAVTACAAARAGLVRASEIDYYPVVSPEDGSVGALVGHRLPEITKGFEGFARLLRIAQAALGDLQQQVPNEPWASTPTGFYLSLADTRRICTGANLVADLEAQKEMTTDWENTPIDDELPQRLLHSAAKHNRWRGEPSIRFTSWAGATGVAEAMNAAMDDLREKKVELAVVGGIDSLLDEDTLGWLDATRRLKDPGMPVGLQPGEGGAFLLLELTERAIARAAPPLAWLDSVVFTKESRPLFSGEPPLGDGLADLLLGMSQAAGWRDFRPMWLITDQNGETCRAMEWGYAVVRTADRLQVLSSAILWYPAASFGDTGAATGAIAATAAVAAFRRGYAPSQFAAIVCSGHDSARAGILLTAPA